MSEFPSVFLRGGYSGGSMPVAPTAGSPRSDISIFSIIESCEQHIPTYSATTTQDQKKGGGWKVPTHLRDREGCSRPPVIPGHDFQVSWSDLIATTVEHGSNMVQ